MATLGFGAALAVPLFSTVATAATAAQRGDPVGDAHRRPVASVAPAAGSPVVRAEPASPGRELAVPSEAAASPVARKVAASPAAGPPGGFPGAGGFRAGAGTGTGTGGFPGGPLRRGAGRRRWRAGGAGFLNSSQSNAALNKALQADAGKYTWAAATVNSNNAAGYQLGSGEPVMAIGGFNGTDPAPTLAQFEKYVSEGKIHYFIASGGGGFGGGRRRRPEAGRGGSGDGSEITSWVEAHFTAQTLGGVTVYNLTTGVSLLRGDRAAAFSRATRCSAPAWLHRRR